MREVSIQELIPGMVVSEDILSEEHKCIVPAGVILTDPIIARLSTYAIYSVWVDDIIMQELFDKAKKPSFSKTDQAHLITEFQQDWERLVYLLRESIMRTIRRRTPINVDELVEKTVMVLSKNDYQAVNIFELLLYTQWHEDSVFAHSLNVAIICHKLSSWLDFSQEDRKLSIACGLFHDIGKMLIPSSILQKPDRLTGEEFEIIKTHTTEGYHFLNYFDINPHIKTAALMHHEKCDGSGYPYGIEEDAIDPFAKLVTVADIFEAMTSVRIYRDAMCPFEVIDYFQRDGLQKYDHRYIMTFLENTANAYLNHKVTLSNGLEGTVVFINKDHISQPTIQYRNEFWDLSKKTNIHIEAVL